jgi:peptide-methionine (R)-S-oxide reductase
MYTEPPFTGKYVNEKGKGIYVCSNCGLELFSSDTKQDSNKGPVGLQGWPSFSDALPGAVEFKKDVSGGMDRTEVVCARCGEHLGHLFDDNEVDTGKHFCINSCDIDLEEEKNEA